MLHRYWLKLKPSAEPTVLNLGCGITAYDKEDARAIFETIVLPAYGTGKPIEIAEIIENIDVSTLDEAHVKPNMGIPSNRGVWFPLV